MSFIRRLMEIKEEQLRNEFIRMQYLSNIQWSNLQILELLKNGNKTRSKR